MNYEQAYSKLEEILVKLSDNKLGLDQATKLFEESIELSKICYDKLKETQGKILVYKEKLEELKNIDDK